MFTRRLSGAFEQEPGAALGLVHPVFDQAGCRDIAVLVAEIVGLLHQRDEREVVLAEFGRLSQRRSSSCAIA